MEEWANQNTKLLIDPQMIHAEDAIILALDSKGRILIFDDFRKQVTGYSQKEVIGKNWVDCFVPPSERKAVREAFKVALSRETSGRVIHSRVLDKKGNVKTVDWIDTIVQGPKDERYVISFGRDITDRVKLRHELQRSEAQFKGVFEASPIGIGVFDGDGNVLSLNRSFLRIFGANEQKDCAKLDLFRISGIKVEETKRLIDGKIVRHEQKYEQRELCKTKGCKLDNQSVMHLQWVITRLEKNVSELPGYLAQVEDITEQKKLLAIEELYKEELKADVERKTTQLTEANKKLKEIEKTKNQFLFDIGHELKTPLAVIEMNFVTMVHGKLGVDARKASMAMIRHNIFRLKEKIEEIIQLSRLDSGAEIQKVEIDLAKIMEKAVELHTDFAKVKSVELKKDICKGVVMVKGDERLVTYAVNNLISNAIKFTKDGWIKVSLEVRGTMAFARVVDTGPGIKSSQVGKLFRKFYKADPSGPGTGVGLYIAKKIAKTHGGDVWFEPNSPHGAIFNITLPIKKD